MPVSYTSSDSFTCDSFMERFSIIYLYPICIHVIRHSTTFLTYRYILELVASAHQGRLVKRTQFTVPEKTENIFKRINGILNTS